MAFNGGPKIDAKRGWSCCHLERCKKVEHGYLHFWRKCCRITNFHEDVWRLLILFGLEYNFSTWVCEIDMRKYVM
jgi:hypothetical protein